MKSENVSIFLVKRVKHIQFVVNSYIWRTLHLVRKAKISHASKSLVVHALSESHAIANHMRKNLPSASDHVTKDNFSRKMGQSIQEWTK